MYGVKLMSLQKGKIVTEKVHFKIANCGEELYIAS